MSDRHFYIKKFRDENHLLSRLFENNILKYATEIDAFNFYKVNNPINLKTLIYEKETKKNIKFTSEGLITTYPTENFTLMLKNYFKDKIKDSLKRYTFKDFGIDNSDDIVFGYIDKESEEDNISPMLSFLVPIYSSELDKNEEILKDIADKSYLFGYYLTSIDYLKHKYMNDIKILILQFEAKFPKNKFEFADILLHVTPFKYLEKIKKFGLVPKSKSAEFKYDDRIYLFNQCSKNIAINYGTYKAKENNDDKFCVFKILKTNLVNDPKFKNGKLNFYIDSAFDNENGVTAVFTYNNISLDLLEDTCLVFDISNLSKYDILKFK